LRSRLVSTSGKLVLAVEQSRSELVVRTAKVQALARQMKRLAAGSVSHDLRKNLRDMFLIVAGEEYYFKIWQNSEAKLRIFPSEGGIKNHRVSLNPQNNYKEVSKNFRKEIQLIVADSRDAEDIFSHFIKNYHLYVHDWRGSIQLKSRHLSREERSVLLKNLLALESFFVWNNQRDIAMIERLKKVTGNKILLAGSGHSASLRLKFKSRSQRF